MDWAAKNPSEKKPESLKLNQKQLFFLSYGQVSYTLLWTHFYLFAIHNHMIKSVRTVYHKVYYESRHFYQWLSG